MVKRVAILGAGPAGLLAAHGAWFSGLRHNQIKIFTKELNPSELHGAQYLHRYIPSVGPLNTFEVDYVLNGTIEQYRQKVYGKNTKVEYVSPMQYSGKQTAWDIREFYGCLWDIYSDANTMHKVKVDAEVVNDLKQDFDLVISTIPRRYTCFNPRHNFESKQIWALPDGYGSIVPPPDNTVICDGTDDAGWYRNAMIKGHHSVEWPGGNKPPVEGVVKVSKPIDTNCDCFPDAQCAGRYGLWKKGQLAHHAFERAEELLRVA